MNPVGAGLGNVVYDRTHVATIGCAEVVGDDLNLIDCFFVLEEELRAADRVVVIRLTIYFEVVGTATLAVGREARAVCIGEVVGVSCDDAGNQEGQLVEPAGQWEVCDLLGVEGRRDLRLSRFQEVCPCAYVHRCDRRTGLKLLGAQGYRAIRIHANVISTSGSKNLDLRFLIT